MIYSNYSIDQQIKKFTVQQEEISIWFQQNNVSHPQFEEKLRQYNNATIKIEQLTNLRGGFAAKLTVKTVSIPRTRV